MATGYALSFGARLQREERTMATGAGATKSDTSTLSVSFFTPKSLFRNIFHITPLNSKILRDFMPNPMIPKDRGGVVNTG